MNQVVRYIRRSLGIMLRTGVLLKNYGVDAWRYARYSQMYRYGNHCSHMQAHITAMAHVLEKGLSLEHTRPDFGIAVREELLENLLVYSKLGYPLDHLSYQKGIAVLHAYVEYHREIGYGLRTFEDQVDVLPQCKKGYGGVFRISSERITQGSKGSFPELAQTRYSIRHFSNQKIDLDRIHQAIDVARKTPSVCNRQSWHVYWIQDVGTQNDVADLQGGCRGFSEQIQVLLVIACDVRSFFGINERNQAYIDGGLFSMSVMYALHHEGLGCCPLNWSADVNKDRKLKKLIQIPDHMDVIMLLAIGHLPDSLLVARSARKESSTFVHLRPE